MSTQANPEASIYHEIDRESRHIRLLTLLPGNWTSDLRCTLEIASLENVPEYQALSYVWGERHTLKKISINEQDVYITTNLEAVLRHIRSHDQSLRIWVDALCIDQENSLEKSHQVAMMGEVYRYCQFALLWLGCPQEYFVVDNLGAPPAHDDPFIPFRILAQNMHCAEIFSADHTSPDPFQQIHLPKSWLCFRDAVATSSWWTRIWTVQETILPEKAIARYGMHSIDWRSIEVAAELASIHRQTCCYRFLGRLPIFDYNILRDLLTRIRDITKDRQRFARHITNNLRFTTQVYGYRDCRDLRDKIFSLLDITNSQEKYQIVPDYTKTSREVFIDAFKRMTKVDSTLEYLLGSDFENTDLQLPSWVPDFTYRLNPRVITKDRDRADVYITLFNVSRNKLPLCDFTEDDIMRVRGVYIDTVDAVVPYNAHLKWEENWEEWLRTARRCIYGHKDFALASQKQESFFRTVHLDSAYDYPAHRWRRMNRLEYDLFQDFDTVSFSGESLKPWHTIDLNASCTMAGLHRAFFVTKDKSFGMCSANVRTGDHVWVFHGGQAPFVLRPETSLVTNGEEGYYNFIGDCYLHGIMDGEALEGDPSPRVVNLV